MVKNELELDPSHRSANRGRRKRAAHGTIQHSTLAAPAVPAVPAAAVRCALNPPPPPRPGLRSALAAIVRGSIKHHPQEGCWKATPARRHLRHAVAVGVAAAASGQAPPPPCALVCQALARGRQAGRAKMRLLTYRHCKCARPSEPISNLNLTVRVTKFAKRLSVP